jgi:hypothetical protein
MPFSLSPFFPDFPLRFPARGVNVPGQPGSLFEDLTHPFPRNSILVANDL